MACYIEPLDNSMEYTALCTEPLDAHRRVALRRYALWA